VGRTKSIWAFGRCKKLTLLIIYFGAKFFVIYLLLGLHLGPCTTEPHQPALSVLVILELESHSISGWAWTAVLLFVFFRVAGMSGMHHCTQLLVEMGSGKLFAPTGLKS
jgi:hypothetical protein